MHQQASLLDLLSPADGGSFGLAGLMPAVRAAMFKSADGYAPGRKMLADAITAIARREGVALTSTGAKSVSEDLLDKWLQPGASAHEPSIQALFCFCLATNDFSPLGPMLALAGLTVIPRADLAALAYGKESIALKKAKKKMQQLEAIL